MGRSVTESGCFELGSMCSIAEVVGEYRRWTASGKEVPEAAMITVRGEWPRASSWTFSLGPPAPLCDLPRLPSSHFCRDRKRLPSFYILRPVGPALPVFPLGWACEARLCSSSALLLRCTRQSRNNVPSELARESRYCSCSYRAEHEG